MKTVTTMIVCLAVVYAADSYFYQGYYFRGFSQLAREVIRSFH